MRWAKFRANFTLDHLFIALALKFRGEIQIGPKLPYSCRPGSPTLRPGNKPPPANVSCSLRHHSAPSVDVDPWRDEDIAPVVDLLTAQPTTPHGDRALPLAGHRYGAAAAAADSSGAGALPTYKVASQLEVGLEEFELFIIDCLRGALL